LQPLRDLYEKKVYQGLNYLLLHLRHNPELLDSTVWLIAVKGGMWNAISQQFFKQIESDLSKMSQLATGVTNIDFNLTDSHWKNIRQDIKQYWKHHYVNPLPMYEPWAELFQQLNCHNLAVCFNWISQGIVPKKLFGKFHQKGYERSIYNGMSVRRRPNLWEVIGDFYQDYYPFVIIMGLIMVLGLSVFMALKNFGQFFETSNGPERSAGIRNRPNPSILRRENVNSYGPLRPEDEKDTFNNRQDNSSDSPSDSARLTESENSSILEVWEKNALKEFDTTREQLQKLVHEIKSELKEQFPEITEQQIIENLKNILENDLNYNKELIDPDSSQKEKLKWIRAIEKYQKENLEFEKYGYLDPSRPQTFNSLKQALMNKIQQDLSSEPSSGSSLPEQLRR
ncbi:MAG: hypothetical protein ACRCU2_05700, partial [Planktothrix sp.]